MKYLLLALMLAITSCTTTRYVDKIVEVPKVQLVYETKVQKDSIYIKDSVYIHQSGETIFADNWHTKFIERLRVDTFIKKDSVHVPVEVETTVVLKPGLLEKVRTGAEALLLGLIAGIAITAAYMLRKK